MGRASFAIYLALASCASSSFASNVYRQGPVAFRVGELPQTWRKVDAESDLAFRSPEGGTIYANVECEETADAPLDVLANHLLFGVDVEAEQRREITLAGRKALRTKVRGEVDGVPIRLDTIVLMKDGCTYDLGLVAGPGDFREQEDAFDRFVAGFATLEDAGRAAPLAAGEGEEEEADEEEAWACSIVPC